MQIAIANKSGDIHGAKGIPNRQANIQGGPLQCDLGRKIYIRRRAGHRAIGELR
jgi:hypothetical protein